MQNRSMVGEIISKYAEAFLSAVDHARNCAKLDSELQVNDFKRSPGTGKEETIPPPCDGEKNPDDKKGGRNNEGRTDQIDEHNKEREETVRGTST